MQPLRDIKINQPVDLREIVRKKKAGTADVHIHSSTEEITISTDEVFVDETYQKRLSLKWAKEIAKNFDPEMFGKPRVARRHDGRYAVIDGQHRITALSICFPGQKVTFNADLEINADSVQREAKSFNAMNTYIRKSSSGDELRALVAQGDKEAIAYMEILDRAGFKTKWGGGKTRAGSIGPYVFKTAKKFCTSTWKDDLEDALTVCARAWGVNAFPISSTLILGIALMFKRYRHDPRFSADRIVEKVSKKTPMALTAAGHQRAILDNTRQEYGVRVSLRLLYNTRLDAKNQLPEYF